MPAEAEIQYQPKLSLGRPAERKNSAAQHVHAGDISAKQVGEAGWQQVGQRIGGDRRVGSDQERRKRKYRHHGYDEIAHRTDLMRTQQAERNSGVQTGRVPLCSILGQIQHGGFSSTTFRSRNSELKSGAMGLTRQRPNTAAVALND